MPVLAVGAVGAAIGAGAGVAAGLETFAAIATAASLGFSVGTAIGGLLFPTHNTVTNVGPRLGDLSVMASQYGTFIPIVFGTDRLAGNVIWARPIKEVENTSSSTSGGKKGKKGGTTTTNTTYSYFGNFACAFCEGQKAAVLRIWANGTLIYDVTSGTDSVGMQGLGFSFYDGGEAQMPNSAIEADKGVGNVPGFRGLCYIVFHDLPLEKFGNQMPSITCEIASLVTSIETIQPITPALAADGSTGSWITAALDLNRNVGYGIIDNTTVARFSLDTMVIDKQFTFASAVPNTPGGGPLASVNYYEFIMGADEALYVKAPGVGYPLEAMYVLRIDPNTGKQTGSCRYGTGLLFDDYVLFATTRWFDFLGQQHNLLLCITGDIYGPHSYALVDCESMVLLDAVTPGLGLIALGGAGVAVYTPTALSAEFGGYMRDWTQGPISAEGSDLLFAVTARAGTSGQSNTSVAINRMRIDPGGVVLYTSVAILQNTFDATATDLQPNFIGYDSGNASVILQITVVTPAMYRYFYIAVDVTAGTVLWQTEGGQIPSTYYGADMSNYTLLDGTFVGMTPPIAGNFGVGAGSKTAIYDTATGAARIIDGASLLSSRAGIAWNSSRQSYLRVVDRNYSVTPTTPSSIDKVTIGRQTGTNTNLGEICGGVSRRVRVPDYDTSTVDPLSVRGFTLSRLDSAANSLTALLAGFQVDVVESDFRVVFKLRGSTVIATIAENDLVRPDGDQAPEPYKETRQQELELPSFQAISYTDYDLNYQTNTQSAARVRLAANPTMFSAQTASLQIPIVMSAAMARQTAETVLYTTWVNRHTFQARLSARYLWLDPADVVQLTLNTGYTQRSRLGQTDFGVDNTSDTLLIAESDGQYVSIAQATSVNPNPQTIGSAAPSLTILLDVPLLRDTDEASASTSRGYWGASTFFGGTYRGAVLYQSPDGANWTQAGAVTAPTTFGYVDTPPPDPTLMWATELDTSLIVTMSYGEANLVSIPDADLFYGKNVAALIKTDNTVELIQFRDVTPLGGSRYQLSNLLRGRRGTDTMAFGHTTGEMFVLLSTTTIDAIAGPLTERGISHYWGAVTIGTQPDPTLRESFTFHARDKMPYAPVNATATKSGTDIILSWMRRTRYGGDWLGGTDIVTLAESAEAYEVDILAGPGGALKRTLTGIATPSVTYTAAQITTDFGATPPTSLTVRVYQISSLVGRGFTREQTVVVN